MLAMLSGLIRKTKNKSLIFLLQYYPIRWNTDIRQDTLHIQ